MGRAITLVDQLGTYIHEPVNCLTHGLGAVLSGFGMVSLLRASWGEPIYMLSFAIYGLSAVLLYSASALFHGLKVGPKGRRLLLKLDHAGIFALIAGSYTPIALVSLRANDPGLGWTFFSSIWLFAVLGILLKMRFLDAPRWLSTLIYLLLGWAALFAFSPIRQALPWGGEFLMYLGGLFYSVGAVVFVLKRPDLYPGLLGHHELWHLFVLAGSASHFLLLFLYVTP